jgi:hypothetical protein
MPVSPPVINTTCVLISQSFVGPPESQRRFVRVITSSRGDHRQRRSISIVEVKVAAAGPPH